MDNLAATPLNLLTATDVHTRREPTDAAGDGGAFEEVLGSEIALIAPDVIAQAAQLLESGLPSLTADETATAPDGTQILDAILDSASMLPGAGLPALMPALQTAEQLVDARLAQARGPALPTVQGQLTAAGAETRTDGTDLQLDEDATLPTSDMAALAARPVTAQSADVKPTAPSATPAPATVLAASGTTPDSAERLVLAQKNPVGGAKPAPTGTQLAVASDAREGRAAAAAQLADEALSASSDATSERTRSVDAFVTAVAGDTRAGTDSSAQPAPASSSLDALSSASLMSKWAPASHSATATSSTSPATARIDQPVGSEGWGDAFRQKVVWLVDRQQQSAELHVNPPHLGPVEVMLSLGDDGARIVFCSPHPAVREAIETSLADLRSALAQQGLALGQALVSADPGTAREQLREEAMRNTQAAAAGGADVPTTSEIQTLKPVHRGLVDIFA